MDNPETKEVLVKKIKEWIAVDAEIMRLTKEAKHLKAQKKELSDYLLHVMKTNEINCFNVTGGSLIYKRQKTKKALSSKSLLDTLKDFFTETDEDPAKAEVMTQYILNHRAEDVRESIARKANV